VRLGDSNADQGEAQGQREARPSLHSLTNHTAPRFKRPEGAKDEQRGRKQKGKREMGKKEGRKRKV
jgi:hypothetical protein